jgi:hypothetical protein
MNLRRTNYFIFIPDMGLTKGVPEPDICNQWQNQFYFGNCDVIRWIDFFIKQGYDEL